MSNPNSAAAGVSGGARRATGGAPAAKRGDLGRWSAKREVIVVLELLHGADLESLNRKYAVTAATLSA